MTSAIQDIVVRGMYTPVPQAARRKDEVAMPDVQPIVFVVDDDISVRESLELLIKSAGWRAETFASAQAITRSTSATRSS